MEKRVVAQLLALMDGLKSRGEVIVIGATNIPNSLDPALRRPGRFDREIAISIPDKYGRLEILHIHTRGMPLAEDVDLERLSQITHGFVGADLEALCREAAMIALRRIMPTIDFADANIPLEKLLELEVTQEDFLEALRDVEPSAIREVFTEIPDVKWDDVGGLEEAKEMLRETVEWPLKYGKLFEYAKTRPTKGILLHGAPGTGKTLLAKAVANESGVNFISVKGPALISKWMGESRKGNSGGLQEGQADRALHRLLRRDRRAGARARRRHGRLSRYRAGGEPVPHGDGRYRGAQGGRHPGRHEPARHRRPRAPAPRPLRHVH